MERILFVLSLVLVVSGLVGVVRGRIDTRLITSRQASLIPLLLGTALMFVTSAPPLNAAGSVSGAIQAPPDAKTVLSNLEPIVRAGTPVAGDIMPVQPQAYPPWERQLLEAHKAADQVLSEVPQVMDALDQGAIDRFTAWVRLGVLSEGVRQANLTLHDLTPPSLLDLADRHTLEKGLADLKKSLDLKRQGIAELQGFTRSQDAARLEGARAEFARGHDTMVDGLTKVARVKARLDAQ